MDNTHYRGGATPTWRVRASHSSQVAVAVPVCVVTCKVCMHERSWQATANSATATTTTTSSMPKSATINHANNHNSTRSLSRSHALTRPPARPPANCKLSFAAPSSHQIKPNQTTKLRKVTHSHCQSVTVCSWRRRHRLRSSLVHAPVHSLTHSQPLTQYKTSCTLHKKHLRSTVTE